MSNYLKSTSKRFVYAFKEEEIIKELGLQGNTLVRIEFVSKLGSDVQIITAEKVT